MNDADYHHYVVSPDASIRDVLESIGRNGRGIALLVEDGRLLTTLTDGDIRRGILADIPLDGTASELFANKQSRGNAQSIVANRGGEPALLLETMDSQGIFHLPIVDDGGLLCGIVFRSDLVKSLRIPISPLDPDIKIAHGGEGTHIKEMEAVLMAGGFGKRLMPLTENVPKPMLPVAGKPILERIVEQVRDAGIRSFHFTTHFLPEVIHDHFGDGGKWGVDVRYVHEEKPLGTGGALGRIDVAAGTDVLLMNGDLLTRVDLAKFAEFHASEEADLTVGVRQFDMQVPYGVVRCTDSVVEAVEEKPTVPFLVNAGVYMVSGRAREIVPPDVRYDMTDLIGDLVAKGLKVSAFPIVEYWMDIGQMQDYRRAEEEQEGYENGSRS